MSLELTLYRVPETEISQFISNLEREEFEKIAQENEPFEIEVSEIIYFLLTGETDFSAAWFSSLSPLIDEILASDGETLALIDPLAAGEKINQTMTYLTVIQVQGVTKILSKIANENLEQRWNRLVNINTLRRQKTIDRLEILSQQNYPSLSERVKNIDVFTDFFLK